MAIWGLAFKSHTDDIRESTALELIKNLLYLGAEVVVHDYEAMPNIEHIFKNTIQYAKEPIEACKNADAVLICTEWPQYGSIDLGQVASVIKTRTMFDGRNLFRPHDMQAKGWAYHSIGRPSICS